jgi:hypothetical protein
LSALKMTVSVCIVTAFAASSASGTLIDHLDQVDQIEYRSDVNAIGQTFTADDAFLADASIRIAQLDMPHQFWLTDAYLEIRGGMPGDFYGSSGNILFRSPRIDFATLPVVGTAWGAGYLNLLDVRLSDLGLPTPVRVTPGSTYTLLLIDYGNTGWITFASSFIADAYPDGGAIGHNRSYADDFWSGPYSRGDLAFMVHMVPEPATLSLLALGGLAIVRRQRR